MLYHIRGIDYCAPQKMLPSVLSIPENTVTRETKGGKVSKRNIQSIISLNQQIILVYHYLNFKLTNI